MRVQDAVDDLYRIVVTEGKIQAPNRLDKLAEYCIEQLAMNGAPGARKERPVEGWVRTKKWDVSWESAGKPRIGVTLKSILQNLAGTVPNRGDDLAGEVANLQMLHPEIVIGYLVLMDVAQDAPPGPGGKWVKTYRERLARISGRRAPFWTPGTFENGMVVEVDFSQGPVLLTPEAEVSAVLQSLAMEARARMGSPP